MKYILLIFIAIAAMIGASSLYMDLIGHVMGGSEKTMSSHNNPEHRMQLQEQKRQQEDIRRQMDRLREDQRRMMRSQRAEQDRIMGNQRQQQERLMEDNRRKMEDLRRQTQRY
ncbi:MAG: hypothetical protein ACLFPX_03360 [Candidatus Omnitrophota bacterium]